MSKKYILTLRNKEEMDDFLMMAFLYGKSKFLRKHGSFDDYHICALDFEAFLSGTKYPDKRITKYGYYLCELSKTQKRKGIVKPQSPNHKFCEIGFAFSSVRDVCTQSLMSDVDSFVYAPIAPLSHSCDHSDISSPEHSSLELKPIPNFATLRDDFELVHSQGISISCSILSSDITMKNLKKSYFKRMIDRTTKIHGIPFDCAKEAPISVEGTPELFFYSCVIYAGYSILVRCDRNFRYEESLDVPSSIHHFVRPSMTCLSKIPIKYLKADAFVILTQMFGSPTGDPDPLSIFECCMWAKGPSMEKNGLMAALSKIIGLIQSSSVKSPGGPYEFEYLSFLRDEGIVDSSVQYLGTRIREWCIRCMLLFCNNIHDPLDAIAMDLGFVGKKCQRARIYSMFETAIDGLHKCRHHDIFMHNGSVLKEREKREKMELKAQREMEEAAQAIQEMEISDGVNEAEIIGRDIGQDIGQDIGGKKRKEGKEGKEGYGLLCVDGCLPSHESLGSVVLDSSYDDSVDTHSGDDIGHSSRDNDESSFSIDDSDVMCSSSSDGCISDDELIKRREEERKKEEEEKLEKERKRREEEERKAKIIQSWKPLHEQNGYKRSSSNCPYKSKHRHMHCGGQDAA
ncbi:hypothetical protein ADUPG1_006189, partial [Aduncisulcus paluster]